MDNTCMQVGSCHLIPFSHKRLILQLFCTYMVATSTTETFLLCGQLVSKPQQFDVMVTPNLYGNLVSNVVRPSHSCCCHPTEPMRQQACCPRELRPQSVHSCPCSVKGVCVRREGRLHRAAPSRPH